VSQLRYQYRGDVPAEHRSVQMAGRKYFVRRHADFEVQRFLMEVDFVIRQIHDAGRLHLRLFVLRRDFRQIIDDAPIAGLVAFVQWQVENFREPQTLSLALWLLGRCKSRFAVPVLALFGDYLDVSVRKEAARGLRRLGAWAEMRALAASEGDTRVRRMLEVPRPRSFAARMKRFSENVTPSPQPPGRRSRMAIFWSALPGRGKPPKPAAYIRMILERIRALVHGSHS